MFLNIIVGQSKNLIKVSEQIIPMEHLGYLIFSTFWLLLPAGIANMGPVLFKWLSFLNYPIDFNKKFRKKPIFGKNKTFRGFFVGIILAIVFVHLQDLVIGGYYDLFNPYLYIVGFLLGFGALFGDLVASFFKRQLNIKPGKPLVPFDQLDWVAGALVFVSFYVPLSWITVITGLILFGLLHPLINLVGYALKIKKNKF